MDVVKKPFNECSNHRFSKMVRSMRKAAMKRSKDKKIPFDLSSEWIREKLKVGKCEMTGLDLMITDPITKHIGTGKRRRRIRIIPGNAFQPSIERVVPEKGYVESNCMMVCSSINHAKGNWSTEDTYTVAKAFCERYERKRTNMSQVVWQDYETGVCITM